jgi:N-acetylglucosamine-6-phosphate deacetylase
MEKLIAYSALDNLPYEISISDGLIQSINQTDNNDDKTFWFGPGFFDIQVNGYKGIDYNKVQEDFMNLGQISRSLLKVGVSSHFPTVITTSPGQISKLLKQIIELIKIDPLAHSCIPGIHLEGPFISPEDGPRGAHSREYVTAPNWDQFCTWQEAAEGKIRIITLSPEWEGSCGFIEKCVESGVLVSIGHTNANTSQIQEAVKAGAKLSTHLGNGAHPNLPRHPNYIWSQLAEDDLSASIIADGFHLPEEVIRVFKKIKGRNLLLVSDSVSLAGMPPGDYEEAIGGRVTLTPEGKLHLKDNPKILAGSASNILQGINFLLQNQIVSLKEAWEMGSVIPMNLLFPRKESWNPTRKSDLVIGKFNEQLEIHRTFKNWKEEHPQTQNPSNHEQ